MTVVGDTCMIHHHDAPAPREFADVFERHFRFYVSDDCNWGLANRATECTGLRFFGRYLRGVHITPEPHVGALVEFVWGTDVN